MILFVDAAGLDRDAGFGIDLLDFGGESGGEVGSGGLDLGQVQQ